MPPWIKRSLLAVVVLFVLVNIMAFLHARKFTHFDPAATARQDPSRLSFSSKIGVLLTGVSMPRPVNKQLPDRPYEVISLQSNKKIVCWEMKAPAAKSTVVLCHGYGGEKSDMLGRAYVFLDAGYNVLLPDFMGAGGSEGNECTIGYKEAANVQTCVEYLQQKGAGTIYLMGTSMGAAAIMRACSIDTLPVKALILECPFGSMAQTVRNRFEMVGVPAFPLAGFLVFWGGVQNGFNAFSHNPEAYAKKLSMPVLLLYGERDDRVRRFETDHIFENLAGYKKLVTFPLAGHENYLNKYPVLWALRLPLFYRKHRANNYFFFFADDFTGFFAGSGGTERRLSAFCFALMLSLLLFSMLSQCLLISRVSPKLSSASSLNNEWFFPLWLRCMIFRVWLKDWPANSRHMPVSTIYLFITNGLFRKEDAGLHLFHINFGQLQRL